jgi:hypothetical protein
MLVSQFFLVKFGQIMHVNEQLSTPSWQTWEEGNFYDKLSTPSWQTWEEGNRSTSEKVNDIIATADSWVTQSYLP